MHNTAYYQNQRLHLENVALDDIADHFGTPCFVYSKDALKQNFLAYQNALGDQSHLICYAVKSNSNLAVLQTLANIGAGFDIVSVGELERVLLAGGDPSKIVFSGVAKMQRICGVHWKWVFTVLMWNLRPNWTCSMPLLLNRIKQLRSPCE